MNNQQLISSPFPALNGISREELERPVTVTLPYGVLLLAESQLGSFGQQALVKSKEEGNGTVATVGVTLTSVATAIGKELAKLDPFKQAHPVRVVGPHAALYPELN